MPATAQPPGMTLLHLVSEIRARLDAGMAPRDIARQLGPVLDAEVDLGVLPGTVGILGELLDGLVWSGVVLVLAAAMRRGRRRRRKDKTPTDLRDLTTTPGGDPAVVAPGDPCPRCGLHPVVGHDRAERLACACGWRP